MKKTILATLTILAPLMFAQAAFANDKQVEVTASLPTATVIHLPRGYLIIHARAPSFANLALVHVCVLTP